MTRGGKLPKQVSHRVDGGAYFFFQRRPGVRRLSEVSDILGYEPTSQYRLESVHCSQGEASAK